MIVGACSFHEGTQGSERRGTFGGSKGESVTPTPESLVRSLGHLARIRFKDGDFPLVVTDIRKLLFPKTEVAIPTCKKLHQTRTHHEGDTHVNHKDTKIVLVQASSECRPPKDCEVIMHSIPPGRGSSACPREPRHQGRSRIQNTLGLIDAHVGLIHRSQKGENQKE